MVVEKKTTQKEKKETVIKLPKTSAACVDRLYLVRQERLDLQKKFEKSIDSLKKEEAALEEKLINDLPKGEASGIAGKVARGSIVTKPVPVAQNWDELYAHIKKTGSFELLQRRLSDTAIKERWEANKTIPGVGIFNKVSVSLNKL
jgi:hypothetical protein